MSVREGRRDMGRGEVPEEGEGDLAGDEAGKEEEGKSEGFGMHGRRGLTVGW
jgi:hypothetical protein